MATIQVRIDDNIKQAADTLFSELGLDTPTAMRMFIAASLDEGGIPFAVKQRRYNSETLEAMDDARLGRNLHGPYKTVKEAMNAMAED